MASKRVKEQKWSHKPDGAPAQADGFVDTHTAGTTDDHFGDRMGDAPSMEEILASLEGLLDADNEALLGTPPAATDAFAPHSDKKFELTSLKGFENDANLEQELLTSLALPAYGDEDFSQEDETPVDLHGFELEPDALATRHIIITVSPPLSIPEKTERERSKSEPSLSKTVKNELDTTMKNVSELTAMAEAREKEETEPKFDNTVTESELQPESMATAPMPDLERVPTPIEPVAESLPEPESVATEREPTGVTMEDGSEPEERPAIPPEPTEITLDKPEAEQVITEPEPEAEQVITEPEPEAEQIIIEDRPEPERVAEAISHSALTAELLREAYGARVERIVGEMAQQILREILPGLLEEAIRAELERIKNLS